MKENKTTIAGSGAKAKPAKQPLTVMACKQSQFLNGLCPIHSYKHPLFFMLHDLYLGHKVFEPEHFHGKRGRQLFVGHRDWQFKDGASSVYRASYILH